MDMSGKTMTCIEEDGSPCDIENFDPIDYPETIRLKSKMSVEYLSFANLIKNSSVANNKANEDVF